MDFGGQLRQSFASDVLRTLTLHPQDGVFTHLAFQNSVAFLSKKLQVLQEKRNQLRHWEETCQMVL